MNQKLFDAILPSIDLSVITSAALSWLLAARGTCIRKLWPRRTAGSDAQEVLNKIRQLVASERTGKASAASPARFALKGASSVGQWGPLGARKRPSAEHPAPQR